MNDPTNSKNLKTWSHDLDVIDDVIGIVFREDNQVAIYDYLNEYDLRHAKDPRKRSERVLYFEPLPEAIVEEAKQFYTDELKDVDELSEFFWSYLNDYPFLQDYFISEGLIEDNIKIQHANDYYKDLKEIFVDELLEAITIYYNLGGLTFILREDSWDIDANRPDEHYIYYNLAELLCSVLVVEGENLEYNDGDYARISGYSDMGRSYYAESPFDENQSSIEIMQDMITPCSEYVEAKRIVITWLQKYQPCGIKNLKKLTKAIFN